jgi:hypothetical protein
LLVRLRLLAIVLTVGLQTLFVLELLKPSPPLPPRPQQEEELELILDDILAASDDGGLQMVRPQLGGAQRDIKRAPLSQPRLQVRPSAPQLTPPPSAPRAAVRVLQPDSPVVPRVSPAPAPVDPPTAQVTLPILTAEPQTLRVLEVDPTTPREWAQAPLTVPQLPKSVPPPSLQEPPPTAPTVVLAPDRPAVNTLAPVPQITQRKVQPTELQAAPQLPAARIPFSSDRPQIARTAPTAIQLQASVPDVELATNTRAMEVSVPPVIAQAAPSPVQLERAVPPIAVSSAPVLPSAPKIERAQIPRAPPQIPQTRQLTEVTPVSTEIAAVNQNLLAPQRRVDVVRVTPAEAAEQARVVVQAPQLQLAPSGLPDPASLRAVEPQVRDLRELAQAGVANNSPTTVRADVPAVARPAAPLNESGEIGSGQNPSAASALPPDGAGRPGTLSEFDGPGMPGAPASNAAELLSGISSVARDQVQQQVPPPAARRGSFLDRRYDPFYDDLPDRLRLIEENNPGGLRQVLGFLAKSLQGGGVSLRGGKLEAGAEALNRPLPTEAELDAALGMLLDRWLELHDGDVRRACAQTHSEMSEVVRELLCATPAAMQPPP